MTAFRDRSAFLRLLVTEATLGPGARPAIPVRAPFTGETLGEIPAADLSDAEFAVGLARIAQPAWASTPPNKRARIFLKFHGQILDRQNEIMDLIQMETGKARAHAFEEVLDTAIVGRYYALRARKFLRTRRRKGALPILTKTWEERVPVGVVGFVTPWNFPLTLGVTDAIAAVLAGNSVVLKPDPQTSLTALWAVRLLRELGLPRNVFQVLTGDGPVAGQALLELADYVMFTGSNRVGKGIAARAGERLVGCSVELGGKNPLIVLADADLEAAVEGAVRGCFVGAGQVCISIERVYVEESVFARYLGSFTERTSRLKLGAALDYSAEVGSLTTEAQIRKVEEHVADAVAKGAKVVAGGRRRPDLGPLFYEPTILIGVRSGMLLYNEETFGPVVSVYPVADENEAVERANGTEFGLSASVWTRNRRRAMRVARSIRSGSVNVNEPYAAAWASVDSPVGGMRQSGLHPRHGAEGILKFTEPRTIAVERWLPIAPSHGMTQQFWARWMTRLVKAVRWLPGLR